MIGVSQLPPQATKTGNNYQLPTLTSEVSNFISNNIKINLFSCPGAYFNLIESIRNVLPEPAEATAEATAEGNTVDNGDIDAPVPPCGTNEESFDLTADQIIGKA